MNINFLKISLLLLIIPLLHSCGPVIGGIGAVAISGAAKEKGLGTAIKDNVIKVKILNAFFEWNENVADNLKVNVDNGSVLLTGTVKNSDQKITLTKITWDVNGVKEVNNKLQISDVSNLKNIARDLASVGEIRAKILADPNINSLNFSVNVVNDIAYLSGIASNSEEINLIKKIAKDARFVKDVFSYIRINPDKR